MAGFIIRCGITAMPVRRMQLGKLLGDLFDEGLRTVELRREGDVVLPGAMDNDRVVQYHRPRPAYRQNHQGNDGKY